MPKWSGSSYSTWTGPCPEGHTVCEILAASLGRLERMQQLDRFASMTELRAAREEMAHWYGSVETARLCHALSDASLAP